MTRTTGVAAALVAAATLAGCAMGSGADATAGGQPDGIKPAAVRAEYVTEARTLELAPGWSWPGDPAPARVTADGKPLVYQRGFGLTGADHFWYCSWESALVTATTPEEKERALQAMSRVHSTHYYTADLAPVDKQRFDTILKNAGLGDLTGVQFDVDNNCPPAPAS